MPKNRSVWLTLGVENEPASTGFGWKDLEESNDCNKWNTILLTSEKQTITIILILAERCSLLDTGLPGLAKQTNRAASASILFPPILLEAYFWPVDAT